MIVYFAEPIDQNQSDYVENEFRNLIVKHLLAKGHSVYRPATAWTLATIDEATSRVVEGVNRKALAEADVMVARLPQGVASHGVPMEIEFATRQVGIPTIVIGSAGVALKAAPNVWLVEGRKLEEFDVMFDVATLHGVAHRFPTFEHVGKLPTRTYAGDAGIDLIVSEMTVVPPRGTARVPTGNRISFPSGVWGWILPRSSTFDKFGLQVLPGIIDEDYTGELFVSAYNPSDRSVIVEAGTRLCQLVMFDNVTARYTPIQVDQIVDRERGSNGFGSTGGHLPASNPA